MKHVKCYDNGGSTVDRYTVVFTDMPERSGLFTCLGMSDQPFHPQGFSQHSMAALGRHLGKRIAYAALPQDCRRAVMQSRLQQAYVIRKAEARA